MKMSLKDFIGSLKKKRKNRKAVERKLTNGTEELGFDPSDINPPETRFTDDYKAFLEAQRAENTRDDS